MGDTIVQAEGPTLNKKQAEHKYSSRSKSCVQVPPLLPLQQPHHDGLYLQIVEVNLSSVSCVCQAFCRQDSEESNVAVLTWQPGLPWSELSSLSTPSTNSHDLQTPGLLACFGGHSDSPGE